MYVRKIIEGVIYVPKKKSGKQMILITVHLTKEQVKSLDKLVEMKIFPNRSEAIREAIRRLIDFYFRSQYQLPEGMVVGL